MTRCQNCNRMFKGTPHDVEAECIPTLRADVARYRAMLKEERHAGIITGIAASKCEVELVIGPHLLGVDEGSVWGRAMFRALRVDRIPVDEK